jgi:hypothetical protein
MRRIARWIVGSRRTRMVSDRVTVSDHFLNLDDKQRTYPDALKEAQRVAGLRKSVRIIVEP